jgi:hypothetical protein
MPCPDPMRHSSASSYPGHACYGVGVGPGGSTALSVPARCAWFTTACEPGRFGTCNMQQPNGIESIRWIDGHSRSHTSIQPLSPRKFADRGGFVVSE